MGTVTIYDVAREAGVSVTTVSHVINGTRRVGPAARERVNAAIARLGYQRNALANALASGLRGRRTRTLGLLLPEMSNPISVDMARGVEAVAGDAGYGLFLCNTDAQPKKQRAYIRMLLEHQVAGILVNPVDDTTEDMARLHERGVPLVTLGHKTAALPIDSVRLDYAMGGRQAVEHLLARGHRRILALLANPDAAHPVTAERRRGYEAGLRAAGIEPDPALELCTSNRVDDAREAVVGLLASEVSEATGTAGTASASPASGAPGASAASGASRALPFTAAIAFMPGVALGLLAALREKGLDVPHDVSVVGFGDTEWMRAYPPPITAVDQPNYEVGREAAGLLLRRIAEAERCAAEDGQEEAVSETALATSATSGTLPAPAIQYVATRLIERESVAPPR